MLQFNDIYYRRKTTKINCNRGPFTDRKGMYYIVIGPLLQHERAPFTPKKLHKSRKMCHFRQKQSKNTREKVLKACTKFSARKRGFSYSSWCNIYSLLLSSALIFKKIFARLKKNLYLCIDF